MKKRLFACMLLVALCFAAVGLAETLSFCGIEANASAEAIDFGEVKVTDDQVEELTRALDAMPNLRQVDMYASKLSRDSMNLLFDRYPNIFFGWTLRISEHVLRTDVTAFSTLHGSSPNPPHTSKDFEILRFCKNLKALDVGHNWVTDIAFLRELPGLEVLILGRNQIEDITPLADLHELRYIELFSNHITDVSPLAGLTRLEDLNLSYNPVSDLTPLMGMTWLKRLWLGRYMKFTEESKKAILAALPDTEFFFEYGPTAGTWRQHPHYFALYDFFRTQVYVPFED